MCTTHIACIVVWARNKFFAYMTKKDERDQGCEEWTTYIATWGNGGDAHSVNLDSDTGQKSAVALASLAAVLPTPPHIPSQNASHVTFVQPTIPTACTTRGGWPQ